MAASGIGVNTTKKHHENRNNNNPVLKPLYIIVYAIAIIPC